MISFISIYLLTGFAVWLFGRSVYHIGASGVVYGLVAFVFWSGVFRRNLKTIILALIVTLLYSHYFMGIIPTHEGISWESHLMGGLVGILVAFIFKDLIEKDEEKKPDPWANELADGEQYFLNRDAFERKKWEKIEEKKDNFFSD